MQEAYLYTLSGYGIINFEYWKSVMENFRRTDRDDYQVYLALYDWIYSFLFNCWLNGVGLLYLGNLGIRENPLK